jgi:hypothetical protein
MVLGTQEILTIFLIFVWIYLVFWISKDAKNRGKNSLLWGIITLFSSSIVILTVLIYLVIRPKGQLVPCRYCGKKRLETLIDCPHCHNTIKGRVESKPACLKCGKITDDLIVRDNILLCRDCNQEEVEIDNESIEEDNNDPEIDIDDLPTHTLIVEVKNKFNKEPLSKVHVLLQNDVEKLERISDIDGKVIFGKVREGIYDLNVISSGFEEVSQKLTLNDNHRRSIELKGKANISINVQDIMNRGAITDATLYLDEREIRTDETGIATVFDVAFGNHKLTVAKESYQPESLTIDVNEIQQQVKILLRPDIKLDEEYIIQGEKLRNSLNESMKKISSACDMCIPEYYKSICHEIIKLNETIASTPVYVYADQSAEKINTLYRITEKFCKEMEGVLTNSDNISDFINMADRNLKSIPKITINPSEYDQMIQAYMKDPSEFTIKFKLQILNKLQETDREITANLQTFNINPIANVWGLSQQIISSAKNESELAASLLFANILLDNTKKMFKTDEIIKRLKK